MLTDDLEMLIMRKPNIMEETYQPIHGTSYLYIFFFLKEIKGKIIII